MKNQPEWTWPNGKRIAVVFNVCLEAWSDGKAPGISPMGNPLPPGVVIRNNPRFPMRGKEQPGPYPGATPPIPPDSVKHHTGPQ